MADIVQKRLERMLPELDDVGKRGLFTRAEIAEIVKTRRKYEYRLKRKPPLKQDFLDYIDYEKHLDRFRLLRKKQVSRSLMAKGNKKMKTSLSDFAGARRVIELYRMATKRFKGDLELWFQYLEFCKAKKHGRMKKALAEVMKFHPKVPAVWIYAAAWEYEHELNPIAAVNLMLEGLRTCPNSEDLWVECIRLILTLLNKLKARKVLLGEDNGTLVRNGKDREEKKWQDENEGLFMPLGEEKEADGGQNEGFSDKADTFQNIAFVQLQNTYRKAIEAIPDSFSLRKRFLEIVEATDFAQSEDMQTEIFTGMRRDFSNKPDYWDWLARLKLPDPHGIPSISSEAGRLQIDEVIKVYEEAIKTVPSVLIFKKYIDFLVGVINPPGLGIQKSESLSISEHATNYISHLVDVFGKAEAAGCLSEDLVCQFVKFYLNLGEDDKALKLAEDFCEGKFADAKQLWVLRITEEMRSIKQSGSSSRARLSSLFNLLKKMVGKVEVSDAESVWVTALELFANDKKYLRKLLDLCVLSVAKDGGTDDGFSLPAALVNFVWQKDGVHQARDLYWHVVALPHPGLGTFKSCIELEISTGDKASIVNARKLFECALTRYSQDISLWREYYSMEMKVGTSETANAVYWRAKKILGDASALTAPTIQ